MFRLLMFIGSIAGPATALSVSATSPNHRNIGAVSAMLLAPLPQHFGTLDFTTNDDSDNDDDTNDAGNYIETDDDNTLMASANWQRVRRHQPPPPPPAAANAESLPMDPMAWLSLRRFVCGGEANKRCMADDRYTKHHGDNQLHATFSSAADNRQ